MEKLKHEREEVQPIRVAAITIQPRGRPPLLLELDEILLQYLRALRSRDGVDNIAIVKTLALALKESYRSTLQQLVKFNTVEFG